MLEFQLFRTRVFPPAQVDLFESASSRGEMLREIVSRRPSAELRAGYMWHIGNVLPVDDSGIYFALGRTTTSTIELWDEDAGDFADEEFESAPYTHAVLDLHLQVCAIARKSRLAPTTIGIGRQLEKLFNQAPQDVLRGATVEVSPLSDPEGFIEILHRAFAIIQFGAEFSLPNPFDAEEHFQKPLEKILQETTGTRGKAVLKGENLDPDVLEGIARSAASSGNNAEARVRIRRGDKPTRKVLSGNVVATHSEEVRTTADRSRLLRRIQDLYRRVRDAGSGDTAEE